MNIARFFGRWISIGAAAAMLVLCVSGTSSVRAQGWVGTTKVFTPADNTAFPFAFWGSVAQNLYCWVGGTGSAPTINRWPTPFQWGQFQLYDLKPQFDNTVVGTDGLTDRQRFAQAKWMDIGGLLVITGAGSIEMSFRIPGSTSVIPYSQQALSWTGSGGNRSVSFDTVPISNGMVEMMVKTKNYPDNGGPFLPWNGSDIGWNLKIKKFGL